MSPTFAILAASLFVAQTVDPAATSTGKTCPCQKNATPSVIQPVAATTTSSGFGLGLFRGNSEPAAPAQPRPTFLAKVQGFFGKKTPTETAEPSIVRPEPTVEQTRPGQFRQMQPLPVGQPGATTPSAPNSIPAAPVKVVQPVSYQGVPTNQMVPTSDGAPIVNSKTIVPGTRPNRISQDLIGKVGHEADYSWITGQLRIENGVPVIHYATPEVVDQHNGSLALTSDRDLRGFQDGDFVSVRGQVSGSANGRATYRVSNIDRMSR